MHGSCSIRERPRSGNVLLLCSDIEFSQHICEHSLELRCSPESTGANVTRLEQYWDESGGNRFAPSVFAMPEWNMIHPKAHHGEFRCHSVRILVSLAHVREAERAELLSTWVGVPVHMHLLGCHSNKSALWNKRAVGEGIVLHGNTENMSCETGEYECELPVSRHQNPLLPMPAIR